MLSTVIINHTQTTRFCRETTYRTSVIKNDQFKPCYTQFCTTNFTVLQHCRYHNLWMNFSFVSMSKSY